MVYSKNCSFVIVGLFSLPGLIQVLAFGSAIPKQDSRATPSLSANLLACGALTGVAGGLFAGIMPVVSGGVGGLLAGVAHELNNPLSIVVGRALLLQETTDDPAIGDRLDRIEVAR